MDSTDLVTALRTGQELTPPPTIKLEPRRESKGHGTSLRFLLPDAAMAAIFGGTIPPHPHIGIDGHARDGIAITPRELGIRVRPRKSGFEAVAGWRRLGLVEGFGAAEVGYATTGNGIVTTPLPELAAPEHKIVAGLREAVAHASGQAVMVTRVRKVIQQPVPTAVLKRLKMLLLEINDIAEQSNGAVKLHVDSAGTLKATALRVAEMEI